MEAAKSPFSVLVTRLVVISSLTMALLGGVFYVWPRVSFWQQKRLANRLVAELQQSASPQSLVVLKQVSSIGNPAIESLVVAATSKRADVALAARRVIEEELATWQIQAEQDEQFILEEPVALLAAALADHVDRFGAFGQQWATRLTLDIVELADGFGADAAVPVLADCSVVLAGVPALGPRMLTPDKPNRSASTENMFLALPEVKVGALTYGTTSPPRRPASDTTLRRPEVPSEVVEDGEFVQELLRSTAIPQASNWIPEWTVQPKLLSEPAPSLGEEPSAPTALEELLDVPTPEEQADLVELLRPLETRELVGQLKEADAFKSAAIREVLMARGIAVPELALAVRLFADDRAERLKLVDDLKVLPARTARRWLRELLVDNDAEVRLHALTALATTNDPELRSIARDLAVRDTDRRVAELASQIVRERR